MTAAQHPKRLGSLAYQPVSTRDHTDDDNG